MITIEYDKNTQTKMNELMRKIVKAHEVTIKVHTEKVVRRGILDVKNKIAEKDLVKDGGYYKSINGRVITKSNRESIGVVGAPGDIAVWVEKGTRPHVILPRSDRARASVIATGLARKRGYGAALAWLENGKIIFARKINHPGTKPQNVFLEASKETATYAISLLELLVARIKTQKF